MKCPVTEFYSDLVEKYSDPRSRNMLFVESPKFTLYMVSAYLFFTIYLGPKLMSKRKPFNFKKIVILYNFLHAVFSIFLFTWGSWYSCYTWECGPIKPTTDHRSMQLIQIFWWFYFSRFFEFIDTIFFILHKKYNHLSTLHVIHHSTVPIMTWAGLLFVPVGYFTLAGWLNAFVHIFMYSYYMLAAMGPAYKKYLWWKQHLTVLQLAQFFIVFFHTLYLVLSNCADYKWFAIMVLIQALVFFLLFLQFFIQAYINKGMKPKDEILFFMKVDIFFAQTTEKLQDFKILFEACIPNQEVLFDDERTKEIVLESSKDIKED